MSSQTNNTDAARPRRRKDGPTGVGRSQHHVAQACDPCRERKAKCDGNEPCMQCVTNRAESECQRTRTDKRKAPSRTYVDSLEQEVTSLRQQVATSGMHGRTSHGSVSGAPHMGFPTSAIGYSHSSMTGSLTSGDDYAELSGRGPCVMRNDNGELIFCRAFSPFTPYLDGSDSRNSPNLPLSPSYTTRQVSPYSTSSSGFMGGTSPPGSSPMSMDFLPALAAPAEQMRLLHLYFTYGEREFNPIYHVVMEGVRRLEFSGSSVAEDRASGLYSERLRVALMASAAAFSDDPLIMRPDARRAIAQHARAGLEERVYGKPSLTGILILGALGTFYASVDEYEAGYQYIGMCIRMAQSLGLFLHQHELPHYVDTGELEDRRIVERVVFCLDKSASMWMGRPFTIPDKGPERLLIPGDALDEHGLTCDVSHMLLQFLTRVLSTLYSDTSDCGPVAIARLQTDMEVWKDQFANAISRLPGNRVPTDPLWLMTHLVLNWIKILLNRPFYRPTFNRESEEPAVRNCDAAVRDILRLLSTWHADDATSRRFSITLGMILFTTGTTCLLSALRHAPRSQKRRDDGLKVMGQCISMLSNYGTIWPCAQRFSNLLQSMQQKYSAPLNGSPGSGLRPLHTMLSPAMSSSSSPYSMEGVAGGSYPPQWDFLPQQLPPLGRAMSFPSQMGDPTLGYHGQFHDAFEYSQ